MSFSLYERRWRWLAAITLLAGIAAHFVPYFADHDLWVDEAMLASSIINRDIYNLIAEPLDYGQSAPAGYLYIVKVITMAAGLSDFSLRIWSLVSFGMVLYLMYQILRNIYCVKHYLVFIAIFSLLGFYVRYALEFKPYMFECVFVLLVVLLFNLCRRKRLSFLSFCVFCSVAVWFSFVPVFFIAGALLVIIFDTIKCHRTVKGLWPCMLVAASLAVCYVVWLSATNGNAGEKAYWNLLAFPLLPVSLADCKLLFQMAKEMIVPAGGKIGIIFLPFSLYTLLCWLREDRQEAAFYLVSMGLLFVASSIGFYPIIARLMAFFGILVLTLAAVSLDRIWNKYEIYWQDNPRRLWGMLLAMALIVALPAASLGKNFYRGNLLYLKGSEIQPNISYLNEHLQPEDMIYISSGAQPVFFYKMNYPCGPGSWDSELIGTVAGKYIIGQVLCEYFYQKPYSYDYKIMMERIDHDVDNVRKFSSVYLVTSHMDAEKTAYWQVFLQRLRKYGQVEIANVAYDTYLYHFEKK